MLDIDLGTYPFVTSSNTTVGGAATGTGVGPGGIDYVLGIVKAYTTRVGAGPFPTELFDDVGKHLGDGRRGVRGDDGPAAPLRLVRRRAARRAVFTNSLTGLCVTKLDVLDGLAGDQDLRRLPIGRPARSTHRHCLIDRYGECEPVYESHPGWSEPTLGVTAYDALPRASQGLPRAASRSSPVCRST